MTVLKIRRASKEARDAYRELRNQRNLARASQAMGEIPDAIIPAIIDADGLLNGPVIKLKGLELEIPIWGNATGPAGRTQRLQLFISPGHVNDINWPEFVKVFEADYVLPFADDWDGKYIIELNRIQPNGAYTFRHQVVLHTAQVTTSELIHITSDITAPYELTTPPEPPAMTFTVTELDDSNIGTITGIIPDYTDKAPGDKYVYWYAKDPLPTDPSLLDPVAPPASVPANRTITIPRDYVEGKGDGVFYVLYALVDKALNRSNLSGWTRFIVTLGSLPTALKKPEVPVAAGGAVIDLETAADGVIVEIKPYTGWKLGDKIIATWGGIPLPVTFAIESVSTEIPVPASTLLAAYVGETGEKLTTVSYVIDRLGRTFGPEADDFPVNFDVVGPPNPFPGFPDPTNPNLLPGVVLGSTGDNVLVEDDADKDFEFEFTIYDPVNAGETLEFFWEGTHINEADLTITSETAGSKKTINVPWSYVAATDNGPGKVMYYTVGDASVTPNRQKSVFTLVNVNDAIVLKPDAPTFPHISGDYLICDSLQAPESAVVVDVPDLSQWLQAGDTVDMSWQLFQDYDNTTPIAGTLFEDTITLTAAGGAYPVTGFQWRVQPYADYIAPSYNPPLHKEANTEVTYTFVFKGKTVTSKVATAFLGMFLGDTGCNVP
ncbi:hypothetical protein [Pseudomonas sp. NFX98]|uniref:hypothetical protein n=1 Tax=Pseudomonas sp. NFX98 TaxID=3399122 RepID=UPI0039FBD58E